MSIEEVNDVIADLEKEKEDREFEIAFNSEREEAANRLRESSTSDAVNHKPLRVHFRRPPKTVEETIKTLKEVDSRYEINKNFLVGSLGKLVQEDTVAMKQEKVKESLMTNIPPGMTISRLVYPVWIDGKRKLSDIILLGVRQRTVIHASYVNDFLEALKPESVFLQIPPDLPMFIKTSGTI